MRVVEADIAILGSGFAGSLAALALQREGFRTVVLDRASHPRFAIGESSTPIADMILRDLSDRYDLPRIQPLSRYGTWKATYPELGVGRKRGFSYFYHKPDRPFEPRGDRSTELLVAASIDDALSDTHWLRADVDAFLADELRHTGIPLLEHAEITRIEPGKRCLAMQNGDEMELRSGFVIDATGAGEAIANTLDIADTADRFHTWSTAQFTHFENVSPWEQLYGGDTTAHPYDCDAAALHHVFDGGWIWLLRFDHGVVSAGIMTGRAGPDWDAALQRHPSIRAQFGEARLAVTPGRWIRSRGRVQRRAARVAGAGWAMLPHTAGFVDPLHSTGIAHSLSAIERLVPILREHWGRPSLAGSLANYELDIHRELDFIDALVASCYASMHDFHTFTTSTMLYFAAVIEYERLRLDGSAGGRSFLCADDAVLRRLTDEALERLHGGCDSGAFEAFVERGIRPYNRAGLFHPETPNMYRHTAPL